MKTNYNPNYKKGFVTQSLLDYVEKNTYVSYTALHAYYRLITGGSNSFSHILPHLKRPYRNRPTRRYLVKIKASNGIRYRIKHATPANWIENEW